MIGSLRGTVDSVDADSVLIDVNGVGYEVRMPGSDSATLRAHHDVTVFTYLAVSQDNIALYGFLAKSSKNLFLQLQKVSGVGPKAALSLLSALPPEALLKAITSQDVTALTKAQGIGKKGAQKIILELSGKMAALESQKAAGSDGSFGTGLPYAREVVDGLVSLGWQQRDADTAVRAIRDDAGYEGDIPEDEVPTVLRKALAYLGKGK
ncbi:MAG: Holliday junction branch migration protein RuvA [Bifidobacteriaceae bacterium]|jgi:Holliday junction DNA helicase RuvA|nr:Holliday junction branch migration protein RuvA [Bifidobacteriaceae bacterium]